MSDAPTARPLPRPALLDLPAIGLKQLTEQASLMTRVDRKYLVPASAVHRLLQEMSADLQVLEIAGRRTFGYRSVYYDTAQLASYRAAATGRRRRFKVRRRDYLDTGAAFLEVKTRTGRGESSKVRLALAADPPPPASPGPSPASSGDLSGEAAEFVLDQLAEAGIPVPAGALHPVLATTYDRTTLMAAPADARSDASRITVDAALAWTDPVTGASTSLAELVVVETKAGTRPGPADRLLWALGHRPLRLSKYAVGLALLRPELAANRWHRTLGRLDVHAA